ncbi:uncharacterized protein LOC124116370 [Haliotis rufescens]|uniref:uncharacterized protein LOC124116370 n=1 Tax=Haliotis rufescens TaxID=6454 RepID=UPI00201F0192|nr:uncharacterized protein LOC124116370 [Haliotis rufescens]
MKTFNKLYLETPPHFRMTSIALLRTIIHPGDFMISLDIQDAYLHVPILPEHRHFLRFVFLGQHYQWRVLPFGISSAPWLFTRLTKPIVKFLHTRGIVFETYIDDCIQANKDSNTLLHHLDFSQRLLHQLGWIINPKKSETIPTQRLQFIGALFDTSLGKMFVPQDRWEKIQRLVPLALKQPISLRQWQQLLGLLTSAQALTKRGQLHLRPIQCFLKPFLQDDDCQVLISLPNHLHPHLKWWLTPSNVCEGVSLQPFSPTLHLFVDASTVGWGAHCQDLQVAGRWSLEESQLHINNLEFKAVILAVSHWSTLLQSSTLMIQSDNLSVVWYINKMGSTKSTSLLSLALDFFKLIDSLNIQVRARHIPGIANVIADSLSRPDKPSPTEWRLHPLFTYQDLNIL